MSTRVASAALMATLSIGLAANLPAGSVTGLVQFVDSPPQLPLVMVSKDQDYCGETLPNEIYLIDSNGGLKNVVVFIEAAPAANPSDPQKLTIIENSGCRYAPRILAMQKGERLRVRNVDPKLHVPHSYLRERTVFMLSLPFRNTTIETTRKIRDTGIMKLVCDTHAWMLGYLHVFDHPYFAVTDDQGGFSISNIPAGTYILKAWHEAAGVKSQQITITDSGVTRVGFEFTKKQ